jgi:hypothetical protein
MAENLDKTMSQSHQKETSLDYKLAANQTETMRQQAQKQATVSQLQQTQAHAEAEMDFD